MPTFKAYELAILLDWRHRAVERGELANRVIAAERHVNDEPAGCLACFRDGPTLRAIGHRTSCVVGAAGRT